MDTPHGAPHGWPVLSVIIPVATDALRLAWTLEGLCHQTLQDFEIIVAVDTKPGRGVHKAVREVCARYSERLALAGICLCRVEMKKRSADFRAAATRNTGVLYSRGDQLLFLDADCVPMPGLVAGHLERLSQCGARTVVQGARRLLPREMAEASSLSEVQAFSNGARDAGAEVAWAYAARLIWEHAAPYFGRGHARITTLMSFNFSVDAELFCQAGGFRTEYEGWGGEDHALGRDLERMGASITEFFEEPRLLPVNPECVHLDHSYLAANPANLTAERPEIDAQNWPRPRLTRLHEAL